LKPSTLLRIASVIGFLFAIGHSLARPWTPGKNAPEQAVVESMKTVHFQVMNANRSYWDFYQGFGISISVYLLTLAILLWQIAGLPRLQARQLRPLMLVFLASYLMNGIVTYVFLFAIPLILAAVICICIGLAWVLAGSQPASA
jgi:hypothetical protein